MRPPLLPSAPVRTAAATGMPAPVARSSAQDLQACRAARGLLRPRPMQRASALWRRDPRDAPRAEQRLTLVQSLDETAEQAPAPRAGALTFARRGDAQLLASRLCRLSLVRAGATRVPREDVLLGSLPTGLSEAGRREVKRLTHYWEYAEAVVSSPLLRARETAVLLAGHHAVTLDASLRPRDLGRWEGRPTAELRSVWPDLHARWQSGDVDFDLPDSESPLDFRRRVASALGDLLAGPHHAILVVSHQDVIRAIATFL